MEVTDELYETLKRRDAKFDGRLYVGIVSTGIVCFPSCRSRLPRRENVRVYTSLEDALRAGFRPCKRCKPDNPERRSPDAQVVNRVYSILNSRCHENLTLALLADQLHVSPYHLQKTFKRFVGVSPAVELQAIRVQRAKELLETTDSPIRDVALKVGYHSVSHFSTLFHKRVGVCPNDYRSLFQTK